jgi:hypothetical protein
MPGKWRVEDQEKSAKQSEKAHAAKLSAKEQARLIGLLSKLPAELIFQILSDLSLFHTLKLAIRESNRLNECILEHGKYALIFPSAEVFAEIKRHFRLYDEIYTLMQWPKVEKKYILALNINMATTPVVKVFKPGGIGREVAGPDAVQNYLCTRIYAALHRPVMRFPLLNAFVENGAVPLTAIWNFSTFDSLEQRWRTIVSSETKLNAVRSAQLMRMAALLETYPELLLLAKDMQQEFRGSGQPNTAHISAQLRFAAKNVLVPGQIFRRPNSCGTRCMHWFLINGLPLVPTQRSLKLLLAGLERYPCAAAEHFRVKNPFADPPSQPHAAAVSPYAYPREIEQDIRTAVAGLKYVYQNPHSPPSAFPFRRTENTPYSAREEPPPERGSYPDIQERQLEWVRKPTTWPHGVRVRFKRNRVAPVVVFPAGTAPPAQAEPDVFAMDAVSESPCFLGRARSYLTPGGDGEHRYSWVGAKSSLPHDEREFEWIEAYLRVCRYMRDQLGVEMSRNRKAFTANWEILRSA